MGIKINPEVDAQRLNIVANQKLKRMSNKIYVGIDVGKNGGIAVLYPEGEVSVQATPTVGPTTAKEIDKQAIKKFFHSLVDNGVEIVVVVEDVHSIFGTSAKSNFQFGRSLGIIEGIVEALELSYYKITPKVWQALCFQGVPEIRKPSKTAKGRGTLETKPMALIAAQRLYPQVDLRKSNKAEKPHDGIVDALLMAHYAKLKL